MNRKAAAFFVFVNMVKLRDIALSQGAIRLKTYGRRGVDGNYGQELLPPLRNPGSNLLSHTSVHMHISGIL